MQNPQIMQNAMKMMQNPDMMKGIMNMMQDPQIMNNIMGIVQNNPSFNTENDTNTESDTNTENIVNNDDFKNMLNNEDLQDMMINMFKDNIKTNTDIENKLENNDLVLLVDLKNIEYNKKEGIIKKYDEEKERYIIYVPEMDKNIFVKKENISKITSSDENSEFNINSDTDDPSTDENN